MINIHKKEISEIKELPEYKQLEDLIFPRNMGRYSDRDIICSSNGTEDVSVVEKSDYVWTKLIARCESDPLLRLAFARYTTS